MDAAKLQAQLARRMTVEARRNHPPIITRQMIERFTIAARKTIRLNGGGYRRDHLHALVQRFEVGESEVRIIGSKSRLLKSPECRN